MPPRAVAAAGADGQQRAGPGVVSTVLRMLLFWFFAKQFLFGAKAPPPGTAFRPAVPKSTPISMRLFINEQDTLELDSLSTSPLWHVPEFKIPIAKESVHTVQYRPTKGAQNNGSVYMHAVFDTTVEAAEADGGKRDLQWIRSWPVNEYLPRPKVVEGVNLLSGKDHAGEETTQEAQRAAAAAPREIISFLKPNLTISLIDDFNLITRAQLQPQQQKWIYLDDETMTYMPTVFYNDFWMLRDKMIPLNSSVSEVELHITLNTIGPWKWLMYLQMEQSFNLQQSMGAMGEGESDEFKRVLLEGNPWYLGLTFAVSLLHSVFDALAFKSDIGFWKDKKDMEGLSVKTIFINCVCQVIIFLYLLDNETSFVILVSAFVGIVIEFWKITKAMNVSVDRSGAFPKLRFEDKESYTSSHTKQYDDEAIRYLSYVLYPLVLGYGVYSLFYNTHKSWRSWILNTLVSCVYMFGFALMCPQLYLNYKLKSVAHLPWRQMSYKFLNTIVDDLMAFVIKMPTLHRLAVFRDDLVFVFLLYQRWIYPVDKTRANEFGYRAEVPEAEPPQAAAALTDGVAAEQPTVPASNSSDDFEDVSKDDDVIRLRQRKTATAGGSQSDAGIAGQEKKRR